MKKSRLDKLLANLGYGSRREVQQLVRRGEISLDGKALSEPDQDIALLPGLEQRLLVRGEELDPLPGLVVAMHKPVGVVCTRSEEEGETIYSLLPERWRVREPALAPVGRLDKETSGLLLLTDDGSLLHRITSPKQHLWKHYEAELARPLDGSEEGLFASGTLLLESEKKALLPARLTQRGERLAKVSVCEGRYHQVRRMFAAAGNHVERLHRSGIGGFNLPEGLSPGEFLVLSSSEVSSLFTPSP